MNRPFTSYFDVHQGYKVLTHCHIVAVYSFVQSPNSGHPFLHRTNLVPSRVTNGQKTDHNLGEITTGWWFGTIIFFHTHRIHVWYIC